MVHLERIHDEIWTMRRRIGVSVGDNYSVSYFKGTVSSPGFISGVWRTSTWKVIKSCVREKRSTYQGEGVWHSLGHRYMGRTSWKKRKVYKRHSGYFETSVVTGSLREPNSLDDPQVTFSWHVVYRRPDGTVITQTVQQKIKGVYLKFETLFTPEVHCE